MRVFKILAIVLIVPIIALAGFYLYLRETDPSFAPISVAEFDWVDVEAGYEFEWSVPRTGEYCICGPYDCPGFIEATTIMKPRFFQSGHLLIRDPEDSAGTSRSRREVVAGHKTCLNLLRDETLALSLTVRPIEGRMDVLDLTFR